MNIVTAEAFGQPQQIFFFCFLESAYNSMLFQEFEQPVTLTYISLVLRKYKDGSEVPVSYCKSLLQPSLIKFIETELHPVDPTYNPRLTSN